MKKWKKGLKRLTAIALAVMMVGTTTDFLPLQYQQQKGEVLNVLAFDKCEMFAKMTNTNKNAIY